jgi:hypothetical protein
LVDVADAIGLATRKVPDHLRRLIRAAVVDDHDVPVAEALRLYRRECLLEERRPIEGRQNMVTPGSKGKLVLSFDRR